MATNILRLRRAGKKPGYDTDGDPKSMFLKFNFSLSAILISVLCLHVSGAPSHTSAIVFFPDPVRSSQPTVTDAAATSKDVPTCQAWTTVIESSTHTGCMISMAPTPTTASPAADTTTSEVTTSSSTSTDVSSTPPSIFTSTYTDTSSITATPTDTTTTAPTISNAPTPGPSIAASPKLQVVPIAVPCGLVGLAFIALLGWFFFWKRQRRGKQTLTSHGTGSYTSSARASAGLASPMERGNMGYGVGGVGGAGAAGAAYARRFGGNERRWTRGGYREYGRAGGRRLDG